MTLADFLAKHPPQPPRIPHENADQIRRLAAADGVFLLTGPPVAAAVFGRPGTAEGRYLWVVDPRGIPAILETVPDVRPPLQSSVAKHTNLTGGADASCGGEM
jgi:hypothetical protein